jgi:hypothetical protein
VKNVCISPLACIRVMGFVYVTGDEVSTI